jgi:branched-chain amino acid aminotransferase
MMQIQIQTKTMQDQQAPPRDSSELGFGECFTPHMFSMQYKDDVGWHDARIADRGPISLDPAALVFHYGQEIFEGLKAYHGPGKKVYLFRPTKNIERMNISAERLCMPQIDPGVFLEGMKKLVSMDKEWVPRSQGTSLYIRPTCIATQAVLGVRSSSEYMFFIIMSPVGCYFSAGFEPISVLVEENHVRAAPGGTGFAKAGGNYAAGMLATKKAKEAGCSQVLWLDAVERKYIEEAGTMNVFFVLDGVLVTPPLDGTILDGVTRDSVIQLAKDLGICVEERKISIDEVIERVNDGHLVEAFGTGTAAVIIPIGELLYRGDRLVINGGVSGQISRQLHDTIVGIQQGELPDPHHWRVSVI